MSTITNIIFNGAEHYLTSPFGKRKSISTSSGNTSSFHNGCDYGTNGKKLAQYAIEDGYVFAAAKASDSANYVWVIYPRIKKAMLHYHLDSYKVKSGQSVKKGTLLGYTGKTGKATGIHLHLGIRDLSALSDSKIKSMTWELIRNCDYIDPEKALYFPASSYQKGTYQVTADLLNVRKGAGTSFNKLKFSELSANAQEQIKKLNSGMPADGLLKGCVCTVSKVVSEWGKIPSGWICLKYCRRIAK